MNTRSLAPPMRDLDGHSPRLRTRLEREFTLLHPLEALGPGERWLATRDEGRQPAVLRIVPRETISQERAAALERDLAKAVQLTPHPHVSPLLATDSSGGKVVFAAAHVEGDDLLSLVKQTGPLPAEAAVDCLRQALFGLDHAHRQGIAHGDLKPSDLLLDFDGVLKICNWGCAALSGPCEGASATAADLRGLAAAFAWLLTGQETARAAPIGAAANGAPARVEPQRLAVPSLSEHLVQVHARLAAAGTASGYETAEQALAALDRPETSPDVAPQEAGLAGCRPPESNAMDAGEPQPVPRPISASDQPTGASIASAQELSAEAGEAPVAMQSAPAAIPRSWSLLWCGSLALGVLAALAVVGYLLWR
jgi:serine/threonine-protein kinase